MITIHFKGIVSNVTPIKVTKSNTQFRKLIVLRPNMDGEDNIYNLHVKHTKLEEVAALKKGDKIEVDALLFGKYHQGINGESYDLNLSLSKVKKVL